MNRLDQLQQITRHLQIVHHIPGRIRVKLCASALAGQQAQWLAQAQSIQRFLEALPGILAIKPNLLALSCVVEYDHRVLSKALWEALLRGEATEQVLGLLDELEDRWTAIQARDDGQLSLS